MNEAVKDGEWRDLISLTDTTVDNIIKDIAKSLNLDEYIIDCLEISFTTKIGNNGNTTKCKVRGW